MLPLTWQNRLENTETKLPSFAGEAKAKLLLIARVSPEIRMRSSKHIGTKKVLLGLKRCK